MEEIEQQLLRKGVKPTANRILVFRSLTGKGHPICLSELETELETLDKSSIFRVLTLFLERDIVHAVEDGSGSLKYELCNSSEGHPAFDGHVHFFCESCHRTFCIEDVEIPMVQVPQGYSSHFVNYVVNGICPQCRQRKHTFTV